MYVYFIIVYLSSVKESNLEVAPPISVSMKPSKSLNVTTLTKTNNSYIEIIAPYETPSSTNSVSKSVIEANSSITVDKDVTASSSNIDLINILNSSDVTNIDLSKKSRNYKEVQRSRITQQMNRDKTPLTADRYLRQHRLTVRSPKRRILVPGTNTPETQTIETETIHPATQDARPNMPGEKPASVSISNGTLPINWEEEERQHATSNVNVDIVAAESTALELTRCSDHSLNDMCRICHGGESLTSELGLLVSACSCRGTVGRVHVKCLERWLTESGKSRCELCGTRYATRRVHRYGMPRALIMWILSQNTKQVSSFF